MINISINQSSNQSIMKNKLRPSCTWCVYRYGYPTLSSRSAKVVLSITPFLNGPIPLKETNKIKSIFSIIPKTPSTVSEGGGGDFHQRCIILQEFPIFWYFQLKSFIFPDLARKKVWWGAENVSRKYIPPLTNSKTIFSQRKWLKFCENNNTIWRGIFSHDKIRSKHLEWSI